MNKPTNLIISSLDRDIFAVSQSTSNFSVNITSNITNAEKMCLVSALIPFTFYNIISNYNNSFIINGNTITLPEGNYNLNELAAVIQSNVQGLGGTLATFQVQYNNITSKAIFSNTNPFIVDFTNKLIANILGFDQVLYSSTTSLNGIYPIFISPLSIFMHIDCGSGMATTSKNRNNTTFVIPINTNKNEYIYFSDKTHFLQESKVQRQLTNSINIQLTDSNGIQLKGLGEWFMILRFEHPDTKNNNVNVHLCQDN